MEVVVHFIDGDPDRPLVTGAVYDGANPLPYPLPDEKTKSTIKSNSSIGGGGFNEFRFEDKAGSEEIFTHAQKDYNEVVENDHNTLVHGNQTNEVDGDQTQTIHANQTERVDGTQSMSVGGDRTVHVEGNFDETVDGTETRQTTGDVSETFDATETRSIGASVTEDIGGNETRSIAAAQSETIGASRDRSVGGSMTDTISGALTETITGGISSTTPGSHAVTAAGGWTVTAPGGIVINAAAGANLTQGGGMTRVDYEWRSNANSKAVNTFANFEVYITKTELVGGAYAGGTLRVSIGPGEERTVAGSCLRVVEAKAKGTWTEKSGLWNRFRFAIDL
jgi:type VI secretion system secreted protein VgrG